MFESVLSIPRRSIVAGILVAGVIGLGAMPSQAIEYAVAQGFEVSAVSVEMKPDEGGPLCFVSVTVNNRSGKDQVLAITLDSDDGFSVTTYSGGPNKKPLKAGAAETAQFKTLLKTLPKDLAISVQPFN